MEVLFCLRCPVHYQSANNSERKRNSDELHVVVFDTDGSIAGFDSETVGQRTQGVLETFASMSKNVNGKTAQGSSNYYPDVIYRQSNFYILDGSSNNC